MTPSPEPMPLEEVHITTPHQLAEPFHEKTKTRGIQIAHGKGPIALCGIRGADNEMNGNFKTRASKR